MFKEENNYTTALKILEEKVFSITLERITIKSMLMTFKISRLYNKMYNLMYLPTSLNNSKV